jgi:hypothetical protein
MRAFLAFGFGLFATGWTFLLFCVLVVCGKSRTSQQCERASSNAQEFDEFHKFCG